MLSNIKKTLRTNSYEKYKYSIIIPTWNNIDYLKFCLRSLKENSSFKHQIIILVNEGNDGTIEWLENQKEIDFIKSKSNIGICFGLNISRTIVKTNYIVYANDDMYFLPKWDFYIDKEIELIGHKDFMLSATMIEPNETKNPSVIVKDYGDSLSNFKEQNLLKDFDFLLKKDWYGSTWPPNIMHIDTWDLVGGMSIEFSPGMYSDPDLAMKLWKADVRYFKGIGKSRVYHFGSKSTKRIKHNKGKDMFLLKWGMTARYFVDNYLKRGQLFNGLLPDYFPSPIDSLLNRLKKAIKSIIS